MAYAAETPREETKRGGSVRKSKTMKRQVNVNNLQNYEGGSQELGNLKRSKTQGKRKSPSPLKTSKT